MLDSPAAAMVQTLEPRQLLAAAFTEFVDPHPAAGNQFGASVVVLSTGNVVVTSPYDDAGGTDAGAVYLFNGATGALISTLTGSTADDLVGSNGVQALGNGNYVILSSNWDNGAATNAGAVTWGDGTIGVSGVVSAENSLVGSTAEDRVGNNVVTVLSNGNYVFRIEGWDNGAATNAGAVTWGNGMTGVSGVISAANSLVGTTANGAVGVGGITALSNGNYVVISTGWDNGAVTNAGAVTWGDGMTGVCGVVSAANSLVGGAADDAVGNGGVTVLTNGNYVVRSQSWDSVAATDAGATTWGDGTAGVSGIVSAANSLVGTTTNDRVGSGGVTVLTNGNYVVASPNWSGGGGPNLGAVTWGNGTTGTTGTVSADNSLVGSGSNDGVGKGVTALNNGNYVVRSPDWNNGPVQDAGAVTWGDGAIGVTGIISAANSLIGTQSSDRVGYGGLGVLNNGNYVVVSYSWNNGSVQGAGAVTWGNGTTGISGPVSTANSLVGSSTDDNVGNSGVTALSNGNYVVRSIQWRNNGISFAGAVTWGDGTTGSQE